jgi:hypothetical protein
MPRSRLIWELPAPPPPHSNRSRSWAAGKAPCGPCDRPGSCTGWRPIQQRHRAAVCATF